MIRGLRVFDTAGGIPGGYCSRVLCDAGANVTAVEPPGGDPLRRWSVGGLDLGESGQSGDSALFRHLRHGQGSVVHDEGSQELLVGADVVVVGRDPWVDIAVLRQQSPQTVVLSLTPYGRTGPFASRPATEFTVQADAGAIAMRGHKEGVPFQMGGRIGEWLAGVWGAVAATVAAAEARRTGQGQVVDLAMAEVLGVAGSMYQDLLDKFMGSPELVTSSRNLETPSIEPTTDGYVGFNTNTAQQFSDFCLMIGRPDLFDQYKVARSRGADWDAWNQVVSGWTSKHTTDEVVTLASELRIPVAPVCSGRTVIDQDHFVEQGTFLADPLGEFAAPRRPWMIHGTPRPKPQPAPAVGAGVADPAAPSLAQDVEHTPGAESRLPLAGLRVLDATAWWAGPSAGGVLAALGAEVVHLEAANRPDGMRMTGGVFADQGQWWERSWFFHSINANKLDLTLDLRTDVGRELFLKQVAQSDVLLENFTPRVLEGFNLDFDQVSSANPNIVMVRMPAFGLSGPWRDRPGFAQTMEQVTGLAWVTGYDEDQPRIPRGPCDPNAGMHAVVAVLAALDEVADTGRGCLVEVPMIESALNVAAEQVIEWTAYGTEMHRNGNRSPYAAPQNLYETNQPEMWVALSVETDQQWVALRSALGDPDWAQSDELNTMAGRRNKHDLLDQHLGHWMASRDRDETVELLCAAGVPAAIVRDGRRTSEHPQFQHRRFFETVDHPVVGEMPVVGLPYRFETVDRWLRTPAPTLGQHNHELLSALGLDAEEIQQLEDEGVIGNSIPGLS